MASNSIPPTNGPLTALGHAMYSGLVSLGATLGVTQVPPALFQTKLSAYINADNAFNAARTNRGAASGTWQEAMVALYEWLVMTRTVLAGRLGLRWSEAWVEAGFTNASTAVPPKSADQIALAASLMNYFTVHPTYQVASMEVTAEKAQEVYNAASVGDLGWTGTNVAARTAKETRVMAAAALSKVMRDVIRALEIALEPMDARWEQFGLNRPGANLTPGQPQGVQAYVNPLGGISVNCEPVALATRYRWRMKVVGVDEAFHLAVSSPTPDAIITDVQPGQVVDLLVQAVNGPSQGVASAMVRVTVILPATQTHAVAPAPAAYANGNGNGHGGHFSRERGSEILAGAR